MELLDVDRTGSVLILTLNDPKRRNPLSFQMREEMLTALGAARDDDTVRAVVLTGAGGFFCAGGDISSMNDDRPTGVYRLHLLGRVVEALVAMPKPVIAAVEGGAYGAGLSLMALCDHVVVADDARLCSSFGGIGLGTDGALSWSLPRRVGQGRAAEIIMFGEVVDAERASRIGLVERVVPSGTAREAAIERAELLTGRSRPALAANKATLGAADLTGLRQALEEENRHQLELMSGPDFAEGVAAFKERRPARFEA
ncbi:enoyl-CoA hydratase/isomerase family protein [Pseudonocardia sp. KRD291]|uniref:enoyl-CoA hydratase/isomerase family protein n=1 Tax=Pseudonocardia sp. KRD291 TaxID=2792007 RepID=UPI001C4A64A1|nr:enoyl-CoA hydratase-related protein [Pseudonocardia sp. KRD291]MBW0102513.1 enoyl-CoA hydratase/isomerase family protein [Pseudonocardia sp. KRD291]